MEKTNAEIFLKLRNIEYTDVISNSIEDMCYDYYISVEDYLNNKKEIDMLFKYIVRRNILKNNYIVLEDEGFQYHIFQKIRGLI